MVTVNNNNYKNTNDSLHRIERRGIAKKKCRSRCLQAPVSRLTASIMKGAIFY